MFVSAVVEDKKTSKPSAPAIRVSDDSLSRGILDSMDYPETVLQRQSPRRPFTNTSDQMQQGKRFVSVTPAEAGIHVNDESISRGFLASENALDETTTTTSPASTSDQINLDRSGIIIIRILILILILIVQMICVDFKLVPLTNIFQ